MPMLRALLVQADFVTIHLPRTPDTEGLIGQREARAREGGRAAGEHRAGGIADQQALAKALQDGRLAGLPRDVSLTQPTTSSPLFGFEQVVDPSASTTEAEDKAGASAAETARCWASSRRTR